MFDVSKVYEFLDELDPRINPVPFGGERIIKARLRDLHLVNRFLDDSDAANRIRNKTIGIMDQLDVVKGIITKAPQT
jgi:hypothetical protein